MTREQFVARATRVAERALHLPPGWWGTYRDIHGPLGQRVLWSSGAWTVSSCGDRVGRYGTRTYALAKARKL